MEIVFVALYKNGDKAVTSSSTSYDPQVTSNSSLPIPLEQPHPETHLPPGKSLGGSLNSGNPPQQSNDNQGGDTQQDQQQYAIGAYQEHNEPMAGNPQTTNASPNHQIVPNTNNPASLNNQQPSVISNNNLIGSPPTSSGSNPAANNNKNSPANIYSVEPNDEEVSSAKTTGGQKTVPNGKLPPLTNGNKQKKQPDIAGASTPAEVLGERPIMVMIIASIGCALIIVGIIMIGGRWKPLMALGNDSVSGAKPDDDIERQATPGEECDDHTLTNTFKRMHSFSNVMLPPLERLDLTNLDVHEHDTISIMSTPLIARVAVPTEDRPANRQQRHSYVGQSSRPMSGYPSLQIRASVLEPMSPLKTYFGEDVATQLRNSYHDNNMRPENTAAYVVAAAATAAANQEIFRSATCTFDSLDGFEESFCYENE